MCLQPNRSPALLFSGIGLNRLREIAQETPVRHPNGRDRFKKSADESAMACLRHFFVFREGFSELLITFFKQVLEGKMRDRSPALRIIPGGTKAPNDLHKQRAKILKSYPLNAVQEKDSWAKSRKKPVPLVKAAQQLLKDGQRGTRRTTARVGATLNSERESRCTVAFDAMPMQIGRKPGGKPALAAPATATHRNIYRK